jgi:hypothetical protein
MAASLCRAVLTPLLRDLLVCSTCTACWLRSWCGKRRQAKRGRTGYTACSSCCPPSRLSACPLICDFPSSLSPWRYNQSRCFSAGAEDWYDEKRKNFSSRSFLFIAIVSKHSHHIHIYRFPVRLPLLLCSPPLVLEEMQYCGQACRLPATTAVFRPPSFVPAA